MKEKRIHVFKGGQYFEYYTEVRRRWFPTRKNKIVYGAVGNKMNGEFYETYTIENEDLLSVKREMKMLDIDAILNGYKGDQVGYIYKTEHSERVRCK